MSTIKKILLAFGALFILLMMLPLVLGIFSYATRSPEEKASDAAAQAKEASERTAQRKMKEDEDRTKNEAKILPIRLCHAAREAVEEKLKSPSTAEFSSCMFPEIHVDEAKGLYYVKGHVDAQNSFGAMLRSRYIVLMHTSDKKNFTVENVGIE